MYIYLYPLQNVHCIYIYMEHISCIYIYPGAYILYLYLPWSIYLVSISTLENISCIYIYLENISCIYIYLENISCIYIYPGECILYLYQPRRIAYILEWNLLGKSVKRPFCCTVSILQVYFTYLCYITFWALEYHFIKNLKLMLKENQIKK